MSLADQAVAELESTEQFFNRSTRSLTEEHSGVKPAPDVMTAAQQVAHAAQTIDWFIEGAFRREGFDTNFQAHAKAIENCQPRASAQHTRNTPDRRCGTAAPVPRHALPHRQTFASSTIGTGILMSIVRMSPTIAVSVG